jgi:hypothetical protein
MSCSPAPSPAFTLGPSPETELSPQPTASAALGDVPSAVDPKVAIAAVGTLTDGQTVRVAVSGFWGKVWLSECATASDASSGGCGSQLAAQPFLITDDSGNGSATFVVRAAAASTQLGSQLQRCVDRCVLVATLGYGYPYATASLNIGTP